MASRYLAVIALVGVASLCVQVVKCENDVIVDSIDDNKDLLITYSQKQMLDKVNYRN